MRYNQSDLEARRKDCLDWKEGYIAHSGAAYTGKGVTLAHSGVQGGLHLTAAPTYVPLMMCGWDCAEYLANPVEGKLYERKKLSR